MNIVLTGFMGTGKTAVGRRLAEQMRVPFVDVDASIEKEANRSIRAIFETDGEAYFRKLESEVIVRLSALDKTVISTGGGALLDPRNREHLRKNGILICLTARVGTLLERLRGDLTRPILTGENPETRIERLLQERESVYAECETQITTDEKTISDVTQAIMKAIQPRWSAA